MAQRCGVAYEYDKLQYPHEWGKSAIEVVHTVFIKRLL